MDNINNQQEEVSLKEQIDIYLRNWPWFLICAIIAVVLAFVYLRYASVQYQSTATILIKDENSSQLSELAAFEDFGLGGAGLSKSDFENEIEILKSKKLAYQVIDELDLDISYFTVGNIKSSEIFLAPLKVKLLTLKEEIKKQLVLDVLVGNNGDLSVSFTQVDKIKTVDLKLGETLSVRGVKLIILPTDSELLSGITYQIIISPFEDVVERLQKQLSIQGVNKNSAVVSLTIAGESIDKSETILNTLVAVYNQDAIKDRNLVSQNTADFIEERLNRITLELDSVEVNKASFKQLKGLTDIKEEGKLFLENLSEFNKRKLDVLTQLELVTAVKSDLETASNFQLLPVNLGIERDGLAGSIQSYNTLVLERENLLRGSTPKNPIVVRLSEQLNQLKGNIVASLASVQNSLRVTKNDLIAQERKLDVEVSKIPDVERSFRDINRQQELKESLYLYLLQKREETAIALAVTTPKAKIVDKAFSSKLPIAPKKNIVFLASVLIGLLIPFAIIYIRQLLDTKIHGRSDIENELSSLPILGEIPQIDAKDGEFIKSNDRSILAEAFRIMRTNLSYFIKTKSNSGEQKNIIYVTSTIKGEGKTFVAFNLALSLRSTGKSVILVGADIRNPQIHRYIGKPEGQKGLSEFLYDDKVTPEGITTSFDVSRNELDVILSGRIPPNPAELLMSDRYKELLDDLRGKYDYVVVDTAPTMLVTDTLLISQYADLTVYVSRAEYTDRKLLRYPAELNEQKKLVNMAFVVNDVQQANFGYGTKYGYGYGVEKEGWFKRFKKKVKMS